MLKSPSSRARSVIDIAYAWGFNSLASFYRAFGQRFGVSHGMVRQRLICWAQSLRTRRTTIRLNEPAHYPQRRLIIEGDCFDRCRSMSGEQRPRRSAMNGALDVH
jgi:hypothetical protein